MAHPWTRRCMRTWSSKTLTAWCASTEFRWMAQSHAESTLTSARAECLMRLTVWFRVLPYSVCQKGRLCRQTVCSVQAHVWRIIKKSRGFRRFGLLLLNGRTVALTAGVIVHRKFVLLASKKCIRVWTLLSEFHAPAQKFSKDSSKSGYGWCFYEVVV